MAKRIVRAGFLFPGMVLLFDFIVGLTTLVGKVGATIGVTRG
jgi:hypothetical protein